MKTITSEDISEFRVRAADSGRKRSHSCLSKESDSVQRLCVAIDRGSYIRPHRHSEDDKWELFIIVRGSAVFVTFDDEGRVTEKTELSDKGPSHAVEIPAGTWHTLAAKEDGTILFEIKPGPYAPLPEEDFSHWAPLEGTDEAAIFEELFLSTLKGDMCRR